ncbi:MAG: hypothetical protein QOI31_2338 [Solirubrobacterales bacterium]|nr:hypothetical protein [Solirubrobacterales bacterium]
MAERIKELRSLEVVALPERRTSGDTRLRDSPGDRNGGEFSDVKSLVQGRDTRFRRALGLADAFAISTALAFASLAVGDDRLRIAALAAPFVVVLLAKAMGLYDRDAHLLHKTTLDEVPSLFGLATLVTLLLWLADGAVVEGNIDRGQVVAMWGSLFLGLIVLRPMARSLARATTPVERCLFVGDEPSAERLREKLASLRAVKAELVGWQPSIAEAEDEAERVRALANSSQVHRVILGPRPGDSEDLLDAVRRVKASGFKVSVLPDIARVVTSRPDLDRLNGLTLLGVPEFEITLSSRLIKRSFDVTGSVLALLVLSPALLLTALAVKLGSRGPVFFRGARAGRDGEPFMILKFRSMVNGADEMRDDLRHLTAGAEQTFKIEDDPRVTRVGRVIRSLHLDELPQLWNVLKGEMSLVGPRPLPLEEDRRIQGWHRRRLDIRPGITGPWQILGSSRIPLREMVKLDYQYVENWSLWNDIEILLLTIGHVARRSGI